MNKILEKKKGISLVSLTIAVVVILIISGVVLYNVRTNLGIQKLKSMQADIENLRGKVSNYYLQYGALPIIGSNLNDSVIANVKQISNSNIDTGNYYVIDLSAMENITLTYGKDYEQITDTNASNLNENTLDDIYIINSVSHNIFYVKGIKYENETYYTDHQNAEDIGTSEIEESLQNIQGQDSWSQAYTSTKTYIDRNGDKAIIPAGFKVSMKYEENTVENGLVVSDANNNEWVWIPVSSEDLEEMYEEDSTGWIMNGTDVNTKYRSISSTLGSKTLDRTEPGIIEGSSYREPDVLSSYDTDQAYCTQAGFDDLTDMATKLKDDYKDMIDSINANGGFYVGRYEIGKDENNNPQVKKGIVMNGMNWYNYYSACKSFSNSILQSRMIWGCQWDQICRFISKYGDKVDLDDSTSYGNFRDSTKSTDINGQNNFNNTTGRSENWKVNNIYDFAGNCNEWTQEGYSVNRVLRGRCILLFWI